MAQTKTKPKRAKSSSGSKSRASAKSKASGKSQTARKVKSRNGSSSNGAGGAKAAREAVSNVGKAKVPLLAGGAALVGAAGAAALTATRSGRKVMGVRMPQGKRVKIRSRDLRKAAKEVGSFGEQVGELTSELKRIREGMSKA
jgi:hypothetical protein